MSTKPLIGISSRSAPGDGLLPTPLYAVRQPYVQAIRDAGGLTVLLAPILEQDEVESLLPRLDGLLLSGGEDLAPEWYGGEQSPLIESIDRDRDRAELALVRAALRTGKPVLAICRGIQVLNVALGGTLFADINAQIPDALPHRPGKGQPLDASAHPVRLAPRSRLAAVLGAERITVNSFHHQAVREPGEGLVVTGRAPDGVIEGLEHQEHSFCIGVQWHPEMAGGTQDGMEPLFRALVQAAGGK